MATKPEVLISVNMTDRYHQNSIGKYGIFDHDDLDKSVANWVQQRRIAKSCKSDWRPKRLCLLPFSVVGHYCNRPRTVSSSSARRGRKPHLQRWNFDDFCRTFGDISRPTSGLDSHIAFAILVVCQCCIYLRTLFSASRSRKNFDFTIRITIIYVVCMLVKIFIHQKKLVAIILN